MSDWRTPFDNHGASLPGGESTLAWRRAALEAFEAAGLPRPKAELWKHTPLRKLTGEDFALIGASATDNLDRPRIDGAVHLYFVNGQLDADASDALPAGVTLAPLAADGADPLAGRTLPATVNAPFDLLNQAFVAGGFSLQVARNAVVDAPIALIHLGGAAGVAQHVQQHIALGANSQATVLELWKTEAGLSNVLTTTDIGDNAELHHIVVQDNGSEALFLADHRHTLHRDARLIGSSLATGSAWARVGVRGQLVGEGAHLDLSGAYLGQGRQHHDHTLVVEHHAPHGTSGQRFRGILGGRSRGVFSSLLVVTETGVKADGVQENRNVLLSEQAHADSEPMLRIHTDDVKAAHGTAIGKLDERALFYLRSRGIPGPVARRLLTAGVAREVLLDIRNEAVRDLALTTVDAWLQEHVA